MVYEFLLSKVNSSIAKEVVRKLISENVHKKSFDPTQYTQSQIEDKTRLSKSSLGGELDKLNKRVKYSYVATLISFSLTILASLYMLYCSMDNVSVSVEASNTDRFFVILEFVLVSITGSLFALYKFTSNQYMSVYEDFAIVEKISGVLTAVRPLGVDLDSIDLNDLFKNIV